MSNQNKEDLFTDSSTVGVFDEDKEDHNAFSESQSKSSGSKKRTFTSATTKALKDADANSKSIAILGTKFETSESQTPLGDQTETPLEEDIQNRLMSESSSVKSSNLISNTNFSNLVISNSSNVIINVNSSINFRNLIEAIGDGIYNNLNLTTSDLNSTTSEIISNSYKSINGSLSESILSESIIESYDTASP
jgi:hypothetical protein